MSHRHNNQESSGVTIYLPNPILKTVLQALPPGGCVLTLLWRSLKRVWLVRVQCLRYFRNPLVAGNPINEELTAAFLELPSPDGIDICIG